jgi:DNA-binding transcriptional regulator YiaG
MSMVLTLLEEYRLAVEQNPLRVWRRINIISAAECANILRTTPSTLMKWEGGTLPNNEAMRRIAALTQNPNIAAEWEEWERNLP